jgi:hypothetical protein
MRHRYFNASDCSAVGLLKIGIKFARRAKKYSTRTTFLRKPAFLGFALTNNLGQATLTP